MSNPSTRRISRVTHALKLGSSSTCPPRDAPPVTPQGPKESIPHIENFFDCIRTRKLTNACAETGHRATTLCHLVNICRAVQRRLHWDPKKEHFIGDDEANSLLSRPRRKGFELPKI